MQALQRKLFDRGIFIYHSDYIGAESEEMIRCAVFRDLTLALRRPSGAVILRRNSEVSPECSREIVRAVFSPARTC